MNKNDLMKIAKLASLSLVRLNDAERWGSSMAKSEARLAKRRMVQVDEMFRAKGKNKIIRGNEISGMTDLMRSHGDEAARLLEESPKWNGLK